MRRTPHQYYAVNRAVESTLRASGYRQIKDQKSVIKNALMESPASYGLTGVDSQAVGDRKGGVGSGTPREVENRCPWFFIRERLFW